MRDLVMQSGGKAIPGLPLAEWEVRRSYVSARLFDLPPEAQIIDPIAAFCSAEGCFAGQDGVSNYFDANHMSVAGAAKVARLMIAEAATATHGQLAVAENFSKH
jgi:hypothetical protein